MITLRSIAALLILFAIFMVANGQRRATPPTRRPNSPIRQVDFGNFTYQGTSKHSNIDTLVLRNGRNEDNESRCKNELESVKYVDVNRDGNEEALVVIGSSCEVAGALWYGDYFVFAYRNGAPLQIFHEGRYKSRGVRLVNRSLVITAPFWRDEDWQYCCPSATEIAVYSWRRNGFVLASRRLVRSRQ